VVDHVVNHGISMRDARQQVQPNQSRYTVAGIIPIVTYRFLFENTCCSLTGTVLYFHNKKDLSIKPFKCFYRTARKPVSGGRGRLFTPEQETHIVNMVIANNYDSKLQDHIPKRQQSESFCTVSSTETQ
jgi:hypothetical protein